MSEEYKLIHYKDPTKVKVPLKSRFAKLTLSSNKKKVEDLLDEKADDGNLNDRNSLEKRHRVSRNLIDELSRQEIEKGNEENNQNKRKAYVNPILRSSSESLNNNTESETQSQIQPVDDFERQHKEEPPSQEASSAMEALMVSEDEDDVDKQLELLLQQVSNMNMDQGEEDKPITLSSTIGNTEQPLAEDTDPSHIVSTESQKRSIMSSARSSLSVQFIQQGEPAQGPYILQDYAVYVSSNSVTEDEGDASNKELRVELDNQNDNMTDSFASAITVSDTSSSNTAVTADGQALEDHTDFDLITSSIPETGESANLELPCTLSNEKADRIEAFLRDVSQERKEMGEIHEEKDEELEEQEPYEKDEPLRTESLSLEQNKFRKLASADTESMSAFSSDPNSDVRASLRNERKQRLIALDDTTPMSQSHSSIFMAADSELRTPRQRRISVSNNDQDKEAKRLAFDETEDNTLISEDDSFKNLSYESNSPPIKSKDSTQMDSVIIPETSSEDQRDFDDSVASQDGNDQGPTPRSSNEIVSSEPTVADGSSSDGSSPSQSQISQIQMGMANINISAKINIQIQIPQYFNIDQEEDVMEKSTEESPALEEASGEEEVSRIPTPESSEVLHRCEQQQQQQKETALEPTQQEATETIEASGDEEEDKNFLTHAEKILNELYGKSWQTPDVIKTLKRTGASKSASSGKNKDSGTKQGQEATQRVTPKKTKVKKKGDRGTSPAKSATDDTVLDDFSFFRRNIFKTNLDSTRFGNSLTTPTQKPITSLDIRTEPRPLKSKNMAEPKGTQENKDDNKFKIPETEVKRTRRVPVRTAQSRQERAKMANARWRQLVDSESEGENASDDSDVDNTRDDEDFQVSDQSLNAVSDEEGASTSSDEEKSRRNRSRRRRNRKQNSQDKLIYLDLSKGEVEVAEGTPSVVPANDDVKFKARLEEILRTCRREDKPKLEATPRPQTKRKLFTPNFGSEDVDETSKQGGSGGNGNSAPSTPIKNVKEFVDDSEILQELENLENRYNKFEILNKQLESIKTGKPISRIADPTVKGSRLRDASPCSTPKALASKASNRLLDQLSSTPSNKYGFLKSLDAYVTRSFCHPDALMYRDNYPRKKEELAKILYDLYNEKLFDNKLEAPMVWNKKLLNTAGRCLNKKRMGSRTSVVELSDKVLTSADRLRCTLIHELCHAATWIFNGEGGHGRTWKEWAAKANNVFPELPKIGVCHQYDIEYKYTYKCSLCAAKSYAHSKSKKVENIRCSYCHGAIEIFLNKKDKAGNVVPTPVKEPTGFAKFVKDNYKQFKRPELTHADVMKLLSTEFASLKVNGN